MHIYYIHNKVEPPFNKFKDFLKKNLLMKNVVSRTKLIFIIQNVCK